MTWLDGYRMRFVLFGFSASVVLAAGGRAKADFVFGEPVKFGSIYVSGSDDLNCFSSDGLEMYIDRTLGSGNIDLFVLKRTSVDNDWGPAVNLGPAVNSEQDDWIASISTDGLTLYFQSNRPGGYGHTDIYMTTRATQNDPWGSAVNMGPTINSSATDADVWISVDGLELYFMSTRSGGYGGFDIWVTRRTTENDPWGVPVNLGSVVNSAYNEGGAGLSPDGLLLFLQDNGSPRPGGYGNSDFWMTRRAGLSDPWQTPVNLGSKINGPGLEFLPRISPNCRTLYFCANRSGPWDAWQAPITPTVDFNADEIVDIQDLLILIETWGKDDPSVDIGPMPWGDGKIDAADLEVMMGYWQQEILPPELVAYWKLDEAEGIVAHDSVSDNDCVLHGEPFWQPVDGKKDGALAFDGIDDYVETGFVLDPAGGAFSAFAWIKAGEHGQVIISQTDGPSGAGEIWLGADAVDGKLMTKLRSPSGRSPASPMVADVIITDGQWRHIGIVVTEQKVRDLYVDGIRVAFDTQPVVLPSSEGGLYIGAGKNLDAGTFFSGLIDDLRIYNRALSAEQIAALAQ